MSRRPVRLWIELLYARRRLI